MVILSLCTHGTQLSFNGYSPCECTQVIAVEFLCTVHNRLTRADLGTILVYGSRPKSRRKHAECCLIDLLFQLDIKSCGAHV